MHPNTLALLQYFDYGHLPDDLAQVAERFHELAHWLAGDGDLDGAELTVALRKLLESKDCAVRAALPSITTSTGSG
jgi:hypothetical protein